MLQYLSSLPLEPVIKRVGRPKISWANSVYVRIWIKNGMGDADGFKTNREIAIQQMRDPIINRTIERDHVYLVRHSNT